MARPEGVVFALGVGPRGGRSPPTLVARPVRDLLVDGGGPEVGAGIRRLRGRSVHNSSYDEKRRGDTGGHHQHGFDPQRGGSGSMPLVRPAAPDACWPRPAAAVLPPRLSPTSPPGPQARQRPWPRRRRRDRRPGRARRAAGTVVLPAGGDRRRRPGPRRHTHQGRLSRRRALAARERATARIDLDRAPHDRRLIATRACISSLDVTSEG